MTNWLNYHQVNRCYDEYSLNMLLLYLQYNLHQDLYTIKYVKNIKIDVIKISQKIFLFVDLFLYFIQNNDKYKSIQFFKQGYAISWVSCSDLRCSLVILIKYLLKLD